MEWLYYLVSMLYTVVLVVTIGITLVESYLSKDINEQLIHRMKKHRSFSVKLLFVLVICSIFEQSIMWLEQFGADNIDFQLLFLETIVGQIWIVIFILAFIGLFIQKLPSVIVVVWGLLLLAIESFDGHISSLASYAIIFDFIHLLCATIWVGGIATFILNIKQDKQQLFIMMQSFMRVVWLTVVVMFVSGIILTVLILPDPLYLLYSSWGKWLIVKVVLVGVAIYCGYRVRLFIRNNELPILKIIKIEAIMLAIVLLLAGLITVLSPEPKDNTISNHKMGDELHYTVELSPNQPGPNELSVTLWTLESEGEIEKVETTLIDLQKGERTKETYALTKVELVEPYDFMGFVESRYTYSERIRIPYPSEWQQHVSITFKSGVQREFTMKFSN